MCIFMLGVLVTHEAQRQGLVAHSLDDHIVLKVGSAASILPLVAFSGTMRSLLVGVATD